MIVVRDLLPSDEAAWRGLFDAYVDWYGFSVPPAVKDENWRRLMDADQPLFGLAGALDGTVVGIALCVLHLNTSSDKPVCYLEDLYVAPAGRKQGVATALIAELIRRGRGRWFRLYWMTQGGNAAARAVYDRFATAPDWVRYVIQLEPFESRDRL